MAEEGLIHAVDPSASENGTKSMSKYGTTDTKKSDVPVNKGGKPEDGDREKAENKETPQEQFQSKRYATKKTAGQGLLSMSLVTSNTAHLKTTLDRGPNAHYYYFLIILLSVSLILQLIVGVLLLQVGSKESKRDIGSKGTKKMEKRNNLSTLLMFIITMLNAVLGAFTLHTTTAPVPPPAQAPSVINGSFATYSPVST